MKRPIHLNALRAFEASARHQSFSAAAEELNVTSAAVGQLVRSLEESLDTLLFIRKNSGKIRLIATDNAEMALPDIRAGFEKLQLGLTRLQESTIKNVLTVTTSPAFAAKWLLPKLDRFQAICPETDVHLDTNLRPINFSVQRIDIGVRYGVGHWPGLSAEKLMEEEVYPVCSPSLLRKQRRFHDPNELLNETIIHDLSMDAQTGFPTWTEWFKKAAVTEQKIAHNIQINNSAAVLQSAIDSRGVALARSVMVRDDLASGHLVRLFPEIKFNSPLAYYVVYRPECVGLARMKVFKEWLFAEVAKEAAQPGVILKGGT
ncbi:LysR substrate-binding domain-containing protein [uncultured Psychromonas sp.]|uniref:LysR substrate-binding domain-containing protein n=1 Tax=uncultured Psychromonas sp. TaxID=173974 RepID=UPI00262C4634|nr:LysR substrate-binding domain-containing protein [uncultured Psychromonas sp.]